MDFFDLWLFPGRGLFRSDDPRFDRPQMKSESAAMDLENTLSQEEDALFRTLALLEEFPAEDTADHLLCDLELLHQTHRTAIERDLFEPLASQPHLAGRIATLRQRGTSLATDIRGLAGANRASPDCVRRCLGVVEDGLESLLAEVIDLLRETTPAVVAEQEDLAIR
jgi:hypothetical protein